MLSRAPGKLPPLIISQTNASQAGTDSNKRFCKAWPSNGRADLVFEPTSVLDIRSPSPSSTLSSSFAGSHEGALGSIESGAVAVSRLLCEIASEGRLSDSARLVNSNEETDWAIARDNGSAGEEDISLGVVAISSWHGNSDMGGEVNQQWEQDSPYQGTSFLGAQENVEGQLSGMNAAVVVPSASDMLVGNRVTTAFGSGANRPNTGAASQAKQVQWGEVEGAERSERSLKVEKLEPFSFSNHSTVLAGGNRLQAGQEVMNGEALGRLEACVISYYQAEAGKKRDQGEFLGEVVQQSAGGGSGVGGRAVGEEEWLADWNDLQVGLVSGERTNSAAPQLGGMEDLEVLLGSSAPPPSQEWWWAEGGGEDQPVLLQSLAQSSQTYQQIHAPGGQSGHTSLRLLSQMGGGCASGPGIGSVAARRQLDLHEAIQGGLLVSGASSPTSAPDVGATLPRHLPAASISLSGFPSSSPLPAVLNRSHSPLAAPIDFSSLALPPHHPLAPHLEPTPSNLLQQQMSLPSSLQQHLRHPAVASSIFRPFAPQFLHSEPKLAAVLPQHHSSPTTASVPPQIASGFNSSPLFLSQFSHESPPLQSERLSRSQFLPLPYGPPKSDQLLCSPKAVHRVQDFEFLHKNMQFQGKLEPGLQPPRQRSEELFHRLIKSPPPGQDRPLPHIQLQESRCVGRKGPLDELQMAARELALAADASDKGNFTLAQAILARLNQRNYPKLQPSQRAVFHFREAIAKRVSGSGSSFHPSSNLEVINKINAYKSFCEISPLAQFAHFTANQAILEAVEGEDHVHVIDFELELGGQWASFMQELSQRNRGPPSLRITTVGNDSFEMQLAKESLYQFARELDISLEFYVLSIDNLTSAPLPRGEVEAVAVNFGGGFERLLSKFSSADSFLQLIKGFSPKIVTVVDSEWQSDGSPPFLDALQSYASLFESLECSKLPSETVLNIETFLFAPKIASAVNGKKRTDNWRALLQKAGFNPIPFSNAAERQAQYLTASPNTGFTFDKNHNYLLLGWHNKPLLSVSAWMC